MAFRTRRRDNRYKAIGSYTEVPSGTVVHDSSPKLGRLQHTEDDGNGKLKFNSFYTYTITNSGGQISGYRTTSNLNSQVNRVFNDYTCGILIGAAPDPEFEPGFKLSSLDRQFYAWKVLAETNPGKADISVPQFLAELKDIPKMVRNLAEAADDARRYASSGYLTWRWFMAPLLSDLRATLALQASIQKRLESIDRMSKGQPERKRVRLSKRTKTVYSRPLIESAAVVLRGTQTVTYEEKSWGTVQWYVPGWKLYNRDLDWAKARAFDDALGLTSWNAVMAAWEILPWSWLIDWFSNAGDIIGACLNTYNYTYQGLCIMQQSKAVTTIQPDPLVGTLRNAKVRPISRVVEVKRRWPTPPVIPFPIFRLPVLTHSKLSIVAALLGSLKGKQRQVDKTWRPDRRKY